MPQHAPTYYQMDGGDYSGQVNSGEIDATSIFPASMLDRYDIVNQFAWTSVPKNSELRAEAPNAYVTGYELEQSQLQQFIESYMHIGATLWKDNSTDPVQAGTDFYKNLYKPVNNSRKSFNFPYFDNNIRQFTNNFADTLSNVTSRGASFGGMLFDFAKSAEGEIVGNLAGLQQLGPLLRGNEGAFGGGFISGLAQETGELASKISGGGAITQGTYIETPKFYQYENTDAPLNIEFVLANTIDEGDAERNLEFIRDFTKINRPMRKGTVAMSFPYIYHIEVPCQRYIEWAFLESLNIQLLGTKRKIRNRSGGCTIVPEAYGCSFSFKSLTIEAANFMQDELLCSDNCYFDQYAEKQYQADLKAEEREDAAREELERATKDWFAAADDIVSKGAAKTAEIAENVKKANNPMKDYDVGELAGPPLDYDTIQRIQRGEGFDPNDDGGAIIYPEGEGPDTTPDFRDRRPDSEFDDLLKKGVEESRKEFNKRSSDEFKKDYRELKPAKPYKGGGQAPDGIKPRDPGLILPGDPRFKEGDDLSEQAKKDYERLKKGG
tara:strand:- start:415 stop:2067 length:1653 start_codon:yes stop_codon:yes gene_type:complete